jgi:hypothetical protein
MGFPNFYQEPQTHQNVDSFFDPADPVAVKPVDLVRADLDDPSLLESVLPSSESGSSFK